MATEPYIDIESLCRKVEGGIGITDEVFRKRPILGNRIIVPIKEEDEHDVRIKQLQREIDERRNQIQDEAIVNKKLLQIKELEDRLQNLKGTVIKNQDDDFDLDEAIANDDALIEAAKAAGLVPSAPEMVSEEVDEDAMMDELISKFFSQATNNITININDSVIMD